MQEYLYNLATDRINGIIPSVLKFFFLLFSFFYELVVRSIIFLYKVRIFKKHYLECKVISVGNITLGGTGKTPLVETIAKRLAEKGVKVAILTRGYKRELSKEGKSDEASMLSEHLSGVPVLVGRDRIKNARKAIQDHNTEVILLDDGFQQWRIHKDLEIVTIDSTNPFGNRKLIPRGILREPLSSLRRVDVIVATKTDFGSDNLVKIKFLSEQINSRSLLVETVHHPLSLIRAGNKEEVNVSGLMNRNVCLLASIGDPITFENTVLKLGLKPTLRFYFQDHYQYKQDDIKKIIRVCSENKINTIITTEKDVPRINEFNPSFAEGISLLALRIGIKFTKNEKTFFERLSSVCNC
ncbi:MAG: tetraacyldisaccharide 4'-kinase [Candidatus Omnitrophota bacterium]